MRRITHLTERMEAAEKTGRLLVLNVDDRHFQRAVEVKEYIDYEKVFGNNNPAVLEIGCGKGQFCTELAKRYPDINIIAVEKSSNVIIDAAEKAIESDIKNLILVRCDAEYITKYIKPKSVERLYLNFSCPFPKKSYEAHRLTHRKFLAMYKEILAQGAEIWQKTDNRKFFEFSLRELTQSGFAIKDISLDLKEDDTEDNIETEYEKKFKEQGAVIYMLKAYLL